MRSLSFLCVWLALVVPTSVHAALDTQTAYESCDELKKRVLSWLDIVALKRPELMNTKRIIRAAERLRRKIATTPEQDDEYVALLVKINDGLSDVERLPAAEISFLGRTIHDAGLACTNPSIVGELVRLRASTRDQHQEVRDTIQENHRMLRE